MSEHFKPQPADVILLNSLETTQLPTDYQERYFTHILCHSGSGQFQMAGQTFQILENDIAIWLPSAMITNILFSPDLTASFLLISFNLMSKNNPDIGWGIKGYLFSQENPVVHLDRKSMDICQRNFQLLQEKYYDTAHRFRQEILNLQLQMFVMDMWNIFAGKMEQRLDSPDKASLFERFLQLVQTHCMEEREVEFYGAKLFVTPKYLTEVCKKNSGKTASEWIQNYTTQRLILLLNPNSAPVYVTGKPMA